MFIVYEVQSALLITLNDTVFKTQSTVWCVELVYCLESLCPFPAGRLQDELKKFPRAKHLVWSQEEHRNMGPWPFVSPR
jgi:2-oxoglutarate dehydrogenase complex dehydrogenase (E1) component-like enzyme